MNNEFLCNSSLRYTPNVILCVWVISTGCPQQFATIIHPEQTFGNTYLQQRSLVYTRSCTWQNDYTIVIVIHGSRATPIVSFSRYQFFFCLDMWYVLPTRWCWSDLGLPEPWWITVSIPTATSISNHSSLLFFFQRTDRRAVLSR